MFSKSWPADWCQSKRKFPVTCNKMRNEQLLWIELWPFQTYMRVCHPKGDQSWLFIGKTDAEAETPVLWPPHAKSWLIGKDPDAGRDWGQEKGTMAGWHHRLDGHKFELTLGVGDGQGVLVLQFMGSQRVRHDWATELNWTDVMLSVLSVTKSCLTLCNCRDCSTSGFPVLHCLPESAQVQVHWVDDAV